jgi:hypothetical protein
LSEFDGVGLSSEANSLRRSVDMSHLCIQRSQRAANPPPVGASSDLLPVPPGEFVPGSVSGPFGEMIEMFARGESLCPGSHCL